MENLPENKKNEIKLELSEQGYVTLPFNKDEFKEFVVGLLGKPQLIEGEIDEPFEIDVNKIHNIYELINQRITQQNDGLLVQFNARIIFSDDSSVLINSIEELITYNVIKPVITESIHLTFQFLIKFQDKKVPEKQEINISFVTINKLAIGRLHKSFDYVRMGSKNYSRIFEESKSGFIQYNIKHTARTWGTDIESILVNHFKSLIIIEPPFRKFLRAYNGVINTILFLIILGLGIILTRNIYNTTIFNRNIEIETTFKNVAHSFVDISNQIKFLAYKGYFDSSSIYIIGIIISLILSAIVTTVSSSMISEPKKSYVLLSSESFKNKTQAEKEYSKQFRNFLLSIIISIVCGILANVIFFYFTKP